MKVARETGLEPATSGVTGRRSNQLSYSRAGRFALKEPRVRWDLKVRPPLVKDVANPPSPRALFDARAKNALFSGETA